MRAWPSPCEQDAPLVAEAPADVGKLLESRVAEGWFTYIEADWLTTWLDRLGPMAPAAAAATHGDIQMSNVLAADGDYTALLDWGCAAVKDPVVDFMPLPFAAVPAMLRGHREVAALPDDESAERRIVLGRLHAADRPSPGRRTGHDMGRATNRMAHRSAALLPTAAYGRLAGVGPAELIASDPNDVPLRSVRGFQVPNRTRAPSLWRPRSSSAGSGGPGVAV